MEHSNFDSKAQVEQAREPAEQKQKENQRGAKPEQQPMDKRLDGPNRPST